MKKITALLLMVFTALTAQATVDSHDRGYIVVKHIQSEEFFVERVPVIGCYGLARGPQLVQWTAEYKVPSNIGCGGTAFVDNINALTCAKVVKAVESADFMSFSEITLDLSKCADKNDPRFITMIRTSAKLNFPLKQGEVRLKLIQ